MSMDKLGPYRIQRQLGQGGMGSVYEGVHEETGELAAVKVLTALQGANRSLRGRFDLEIETLKTLKHPHIVQLLGYGEQDGHLFYAMELVVGRSLHDELKAGRVFGWQETLRIGAEICQALKHAHDHGVIHRDLKPANLLLTADEHVKLADFGIAKLFGANQVTVAGGVVGTADYMAPEQAEGLPITTRCDLYSLGGVLYTLLAGRPPFTGRTLAQVIHSLKFDAPIPVRRLAPDTPLELEDLILQLLEKQPQKRPPTALVLGNRLRALEHGLTLRKKQEAARAGDEQAAVERAADPRPPDATLAPAAKNGSSAPPTSSGASGRPTRESAPQSASDDDAEMTWDHATQLHTRRPTAEAEREPPKTEATIVGSLAASMGRFTTVDQEELRRTAPDRNGRAGLPGWLASGGAGAILLATTLILVTFVAWRGSRPPTADALYQRVAAAATTDDDDSLIDTEPDVRRFLTLYADDPRAAEVTAWQDEIERRRTTRQLGRGARRLHNVESLTLVERAYLDAIDESAVRPEAAMQKLRALLAVFDDAANADGRADGDASDAQTQRSAATTRKTIELARGQLERLERHAARQRDDSLAMLEKQLTRAGQLESVDPTAARKIWQGVIELFAEQTWAAPCVEQAKAGLVRTTAAPSSAEER